MNDEILQHLKESQPEHDTKVDAEKLMDVLVTSGALQQDGRQEEHRGVKKPVEVMAKAKASPRAESREKAKARTTQTTRQMRRVRRAHFHRQ